jgi:proteasome assembly chaperone (PAC2) family protein
MQTQAIQHLSRPQLENPILIAGFGGWGDVLKVSTGLADFLIRQFKAEKFATLNPDVFFRYDEARPQVNIVNGTLKEFTYPECALYAARTGQSQRDIVILKGEEPQLAWQVFAQALFNLLQELGVDLIITIGSMYDQVRHTDRIVSGVASSDGMLADLVLKGVRPISYQGPSAIHSILQTDGPANDMTSASLWCHCPFYLQGTVHFGYLAHLATLLAAIGSFEIDVSPLDHNWQKMEKQIERQIAQNPEAQALIQKLDQTTQILSPSPEPTPATDKGPKVIDLQDFLPFKSPDSDR